MNERAHFLHAVRFLTILPAGDVEKLASDWLVRAAKYFPLVGVLIGVCAAAVMIVASLVWPGVLSALLAIAVGIVITGALHEDGLADFADALGGRTGAARLAIMKDSRLGTYGALTLGLTLAFKIAALATMPLPTAVAALIAAHGLGRLGAVFLIAMLPYAGNPQATRITYSADRLRPAEMTSAAAFGFLAIAPLLFLAPSAAAIGVILAMAVTIALARLANALIGGYTGDVLGATEQLAGTALLLGIATTA